MKTEFETVKKAEKWKEGACVRDRTEPCHIIQVAEVMAELLEVEIEVLVDQVYQNTLECFPIFK